MILLLVNRPLYPLYYPEFYTNLGKLTIIISIYERDVIGLIYGTTYYARFRS